MKESEKEKYLGDFITKYANPKATIEERKRKGCGILSEITALLNDIPLGSKRFEMGMTLRQAWFINGTLYNSEVWCAFSKADIEVLEVLDRENTKSHPWSTLQSTIRNVVLGDRSSSNITCDKCKKTCLFADYP